MEGDVRAVSRLTDLVHAVPFLQSMHSNQMTHGEAHVSAVHTVFPLFFRLKHFASISKAL